MSITKTDCTPWDTSRLWFAKEMVCILYAFFGIDPTAFTRSRNVLFENRCFCKEVPTNHCDGISELFWTRTNVGLHIFPKTVHDVGTRQIGWFPQVAVKKKNSIHHLGLFFFTPPPKKSPVDLNLNIGALKSLSNTPRKGFWCKNGGGPQKITQNFRNNGGSPKVPVDFLPLLLFYWPFPFHFFKLGSEQLLKWWLEDGSFPFQIVPFKGTC